MKPLNKAAWMQQAAYDLLSNQFKAHKLYRKMAVLNNTPRKRPPYSRDFINYPEQNPILVTQSWACFKYIKRLSGICLFCNDVAGKYDFGILRGKEVWLLRHLENIQACIEFGKYIQKEGAARVVILTVGGNSNE